MINFMIYFDLRFIQLTLSMPVPIHRDLRTLTGCLQHDLLIYNLPFIESPSIPINLHSFNLISIPINLISISINLISIPINPHQSPSISILSISYQSPSISFQSPSISYQSHSISINLPFIHSCIQAFSHSSILSFSHSVLQKLFLKLLRRWNIIIMPFANNVAVLNHNQSRV